MIYDQENIFAKILKGEIPCDKIYEDEYLLSFNDINPQAKMHILIIPKIPFCSFADFLKKANQEFISSFFKSFDDISSKLNLVDGYRLITNVGKFGGQEVPHLHFHLLSGKIIGKMVSD